MSKVKCLQFYLDIKGMLWKIAFVPSEAFYREFGNRCGAITLCDKRVIAFNVDNFNIGYVRHELLHAFVTECNIESANLNGEQMEEVCASISQHHHSTIEALTRIIMQEHKKEVKSGKSNSKTRTKK